MSNKTLLYFTIAVMIGIVALFLVNLATVFSPSHPQPYLKFDFVRGIAAQHDGKMYTLNFDQQNAFVENINHCIPTKEVVGQPLKRPLIEKIVVYQFKAPDIEMVPVAQVDQNLLFKSTAKEGYLLDVSGGTLINLLSQTYDP